MRWTAADIGFNLYHRQFVEMDSIERHVTELDARITTIEQTYRDVLLKVLHGLNGTNDGQHPGLYEQVRRCLSELVGLRADLSALKKIVDHHERVGWQIYGVYIACGIIGGLVSWLAGFLH